MIIPFFERRNSLPIAHVCLELTKPVHYVLYDSTNVHTYICDIFIRRTFTLKNKILLLIKHVKGKKNLFHLLRIDKNSERNKSLANIKRFLEKKKKILTQ
jgi:hypothetical protein